MSDVQFHIIRLGAHSLLVQIADEPSEALMRWLLQKRTRFIQTLRVEVVHTYNELLLKNCFTRNADVQAVMEIVEKLLHVQETDISAEKKIHRIPVCYDPLYAVDLLEYSDQLNISIPEIVKLHTEPIYPIYFIGFLPGFPYLQGLDHRLHLDRKATPSRSMGKGSVAIGGGQTGVYPQDSPGGWHAIGRTPLVLFDGSNDEPAIFKAGEYIQFYAITTSEFNEFSIS